MDRQKKRVLLEKLLDVHEHASEGGLLAVVDVLEEVIKELGPSEHAEAVAGMNKVTGPDPRD